VKRYNRLVATTTGHRFDGVISAETFDDNHSDLNQIWQCGHGHLDHDDAMRCAQKRLKKLAKV
jgi:hypothetical protein